MVVAMNEREKLEHEIHDWLESWTAFSVPVKTIESAIHDWLDKQAEISEHEMIEYESKMDALLCRLTNGKWSKTRTYDLGFMESCINEEFEALFDDCCNDLQAKIDNLKHDLAECRADREKYRELFGKSLDHADAIIKLGADIDEGLA